MVYSPVFSPLRSCSFIMFFACLREKLFHAWGGEASAELSSEAAAGGVCGSRVSRLEGHCGEATGKVGEVWKRQTFLAVSVQWVGWGLGDLN